MLTVSLGLMVTSNLWLKLLMWWSVLIVSMFVRITNTILLKSLKGARRHIDAVLLFFNTFHLYFIFFTKGSRIKFSAFSSINLTDPLMIGLIPIVLSVHHPTLSVEDLSTQIGSPISPSI